MFPDRFNHVPVVFQSKSGAYTAKPFEHVIATATSANWTLTLPTAPTVNDVVSVSADSITGGYEITVTGTSNDINLREGSATSFKLFITNDSMDLVYNGTDWHVIHDGRISHSCLLRRTADQTGITSGAWNQVEFNASESDEGGLGDTSTFKITARRDGIWVMGFFMLYTSYTAGERYLGRITINGATDVRISDRIDTGGDDISITAGVEVAVSDGDDFQVGTYHETGSDKTISGTTANLQPRFWVMEK